MPTMAEYLTVDLGLDTGRFDTGMKSAGKSMDDLGAKSTKTTAQTTKGFADAEQAVRKYAKQVAVAGGVIAGFAGLAVREFARFEKEFAQVTTLFQGTEQEIAKIRAGVEDLAISFGVDAIDAARAAYQAISAGVKPAEVVGFLEDSFRAAAAGATDAFTAVDMLTTVVNAYGMSAQDASYASDVLFATIREGKTTAAEISSSIGRLAPLAAQAGMGIADLGAALATVTKSGLSTDEAMTSLRAVLMSILKPTNEQAQALAEIGIQSDSIRKLGLEEVMRRVRDATGGTAEKMTDLFVNVRALPAVATLAGNNFDEFRRILQATRGAAGETGDAFSKMEKTTAHQAARIRETMKKALRDIGEAITIAAGRWIDEAGGIEKIILDIRYALTVLESSFQLVRLAGTAAGSAIFANWKALGVILKTPLESIGSMAKAMGLIVETVATIGRFSTIFGPLISQDLADTLATMGRNLQNVSVTTGELGDSARDYERTLQQNAETLKGIWNDYEKASQRQRDADTERNTILEKTRTTIGGISKATQQASTTTAEFSGVSAAMSQSVVGAWSSVRKEIAEASKNVDDFTKKVIEATKQVSAMTAQEIAEYGQAEAIREFYEMRGLSGKELEEAVSQWFSSRGMAVPQKIEGFSEALRRQREEAIWKGQAGGIVPGTGRGDIVPALLEPGEMVVPRRLVAALERLERPNLSINVTATGATEAESARATARALAPEILRAISMGYGQEHRL